MNSDSPDVPVDQAHERALAHERTKADLRVLWAKNPNYKAEALAAFTDIIGHAGSGTGAPDEPFEQYVPPTYETFDLDVATAALDEVRRQFLAGEPMVWTGPDRLHSSISATSHSPSWNFSAEGMEAHADQNRDFWDVYNMVAFQLGYHNGVVREEENTKRAQDNAGFFRQAYQDALGRTAPGTSVDPVQK